MKAQAGLRRLGHIFLVVARHSAIHIANRKLSHWPRLKRRICGPSLSAPDRFRKAIEDAGGTFIKFGQMLALQSDLLPLEYCRALFTLFDNVEPFAYEEVELVEIREDPQRPRLLCRTVHMVNSAPFRGFNRAQSAVIEAAILASRLSLLPREKIEHEMAYLTIGIEKTAGPREREAWSWLMEMIEGYYRAPERKVLRR